MKKISVEACMFDAYGYKGEILKRGICDQVCSEIIDWIGNFGVINDEYGNIITGNEMIHTQHEISYKPPKWLKKINHFVMIVECEDGRVVIDIPMKEYTYVQGQWFKFNQKEYVDIHCITSRNELMEAYQCTKEEANEMIKVIKEAEVGYKFNGTKEQLYWHLEEKDTPMPQSPLKGQLFLFNKGEVK